MRTRFSSHPSVRSARLFPTVSSVDSAANFAARVPLRSGIGAARRLTLALAVGAPLCAGALLAKPIQAAPTVESDENGPMVQIVKPGYNDVLKGNYRILIQVTARKYNPQSVEMFIDDVSATRGPMEISSFASSSYDFDTRLLTDGRHKLTVRVTDSQGFRGWSEVTVFVNNKGVVDTQIPDLKWVGIAPFQEFSGSMKIEVDAADNFGVKLLQLSISPADTPNKPAYSWMMNQPPYRVNLDTIGKNIPDGLYVLKALAFDSLDQQGEAPPLTVGVLNDQINATRVEDMLDGKRQMAQILNGEKVAEKAETPKVVEAPAKSNVKPGAAVEASKTTGKPAKVTAATPAPGGVASSQGANKTSDYPAPKLTIPQQTPSNPGIQLPLVTTPASSENSTTPQISEVPTDETRIAELTPGDTNLTEVAQSSEVAPSTSATNEATPVSEMSAQVDATTTTVIPTDAATTNVTPDKVASVQTSDATGTPDKKPLIAALPSKPINQRNAGEASLSRAATIDLALAPIAQFESKTATAPIAVARFSQPHSSGRAIIDAPMWSQSAAGDDSRLSNAQLSRARAGRTRVLNVSRQLAAPTLTPASTVRALQIGAPSLKARPILTRAVTANSLSTPATKLTRQAQGQNAPLVAPKKATASALSKAVRATKRAQPIAPVIASEAPTKLRGAMSKAVSKGERAKPIQIAPTLVAKSNIEAPTTLPQMSAPTAPRMSESASGLGVPSRLSKAVQLSTGKAQTIGSLDGKRVAALPRPDAVKRDRSGASIVAVPLDQPLKVADKEQTEIPASYRAEKTTTLRAIAAHFGLPVELVAISNNWTSEMKVMRGTEVKLPRPLQISYNGAQIQGDTPSMLMGDTAVTAFRFMFEKTGGKLEWDAANQRVVARKDGREIVLSIGSNVAKVGDREVMMDIAAFLFQGRTMVPLRFFEEGMNAQVEWNPQTGRLVVAMAGE